MSELGGRVARRYAERIDAAYQRGDDTDAELTYREYAATGREFADLIWELSRLNLERAQLVYEAEEVVRRAARGDG